MDTVDKICEIEAIYLSVRDCCDELSRLIDKSETLGEKAGLRYKLALLNVKKETLGTCLSILKK